jgi:hypothetical protein
VADTTPAELISALKAKGFLGRPVVTRDDEPEAVNVWLDESAAPATTVWFPRVDRPHDLIVWGHHLDNTAHRDIPAETLVERIEERWY